jgi:hypothetical protein
MTILPPGFIFRRKERRDHRFVGRDDPKDTVRLESDADEADEKVLPERSSVKRGKLAWATAK